MAPRDEQQPSGAPRRGHPSDGPTDPMIVAAFRTPFGAVHGSLAAIHPVDLLATLFERINEQVGCDPRIIDYVVVGCANPVGAQGDNVGRAAALVAGWPDTVPAETVVRGAASGLAALHHGTRAVRSGELDVVVVGAVEVMSLVPMGASAMARHAYGKPWGDRVNNRYAAKGGLLPDGPRADELARLVAIDRSAQDAYAYSSRQRSRSDEAMAATRALVVPSAHGLSVICDDDGTRNAVSDRADLDGFEPFFDTAGTVTAGNSAPISDGAVALVVMSRRRVEALGLRALAHHVAGAASARSPRECEPAAPGAIARALRLAGFSVDDLHRIELHEPYAVTALRIIEQLGFDPRLVNPHGGSIALGHPTAATGLRLVAALAHAAAAGDSGGIGYVGLAAVEGDDTAAASVIINA